MEAGRAAEAGAETHGAAEASAKSLVQARPGVKRKIVPSTLVPWAGGAHLSPATLSAKPHHPTSSKPREHRGCRGRGDPSELANRGKRGECE
ncbi:hypothetical protein NDU88_001366 [Pleurodeles waltl]|uniref:Uncharacterized protein n=1 Tax=Pleurodeles waltl TaxID=8319 RepID=A0AAV7R9K0_PLEWA|nr:hypothetical protein NDU88_001366 [Pleurodeles waltl]